MNIQDQVCTLEQAKRLKELGVGYYPNHHIPTARAYQQSLFYWCEDFYIDGNTEKPYWRLEINGDGRNSFRTPNYYDNYLSAFTVAELGEMLPEWLHKSDKEYRLIQWKNIDVDYLEDTPDEEKMLGYHLCYQVGSKFQMRIPEFNTKLFAPTEAQARAAMLIFLLENDLLK